jgi:hypothetical protein
VVVVRWRSGLVSLVAGGLLVVGLAACPPDLNQTVSIITSTHVIAVRAEPAEAPPMPATTQVFTALVVGPKGDEKQANVDWSFCIARKPLAELGPVNPVCLDPPSGPDFVPLGGGPQISAVVPDDACRLFGPIVPMPMMNQPQGRPVDPDTTGGYYQPVQVRASSPDGDSLAMFRSRLSCGLPLGTPDQMVSFANGYRFNVNPAIKALSVVGGAALNPATGSATNVVQAGKKLSLEVSWDTCPLVDKCGDGFCGPDETATSCSADCMTPKGCTGAERYLNLDLVAGKIADQREAISVAWFATSGSFDSDATGRSTSDTQTTSDNGWTAPSSAPPQNPVVLWVVLHDDRGGVGWQEYALSVQ